MGIGFGESVSGDYGLERVSLIGNRVEDSVSSGCGILEPCAAQLVFLRAVRLIVG